jgi:hypothetical protein
MQPYGGAMLDLGIVARPAQRNGADRSEEGRGLIRCTVLLLLSFIGPLHAKSAYVYGAGTVSCAKWSEFRTTNNSNKFQMEGWLDGYLSGWNLAGDDTPDFLLHSDRTALYAWVDYYCAANPLDDLIQASDKLKKELINRSR